VYVQTPSERADRVDAETQRRVADTLTLARQLGGVPVELKGDDFATAVAEYVRQHTITHIVIGRTGWRRWFGRSPPRPPPRRHPDHRCRREWRLNAAVCFTAQLSPAAEASRRAATLTRPLRS
jgi:hypothetical protein